MMILIVIIIGTTTVVISLRRLDRILERLETFWGRCEVGE
jgi:hypothetical protein